MRTVYPAMPYTVYARVTDADTAALNDVVMHGVAALSSGCWGCCGGAGASRTEPRLQGMLVYANQLRFGVCPAYGCTRFQVQAVAGMAGHGHARAAAVRPGPAPSCHRQPPDRLRQLLCRQRAAGRPAIHAAGAGAAAAGRQLCFFSLGATGQPGAAQLSDSACAWAARPGLLIPLPRPQRARRRCGFVVIADRDHFADHFPTGAPLCRCDRAVRAFF